MVKKEIIKFLSSDNKTMINACKWYSDTNYKAIVQIIHGMVEYIDRYDEFATFLANNGFLVIGHDHLGHGLSVINKEDYGYFGKNPSELLVNDMNKLREMFQDDKPYFMIGHSMGSFLLRKYLAVYGKNLSGAIIIGTGYVEPVVTRFGIIVTNIEGLFKGEKHRSKLLLKLSNGKDYKKFVSDGSDLKRNWLTKDIEIARKYYSNPMCSFIFTDNGYKGLFESINYCCKMRNINKIPKKLPILITSGEDDPVGGMGIGVTKVYNLFNKAKINNVELKIYPNDRHEILNETDRDVVYNDILKWLNKRI